MNSKKNDNNSFFYESIDSGSKFSNNTQHMVNGYIPLKPVPEKKKEKEDGTVVIDIDAEQQRREYRAWARRFSWYHRTLHRFHIVDPSPWPLSASAGVFMMATGFVSYVHKIAGGWDLLMHGLILTCFTMYVWWRDVVREATYENQHSFKVQRGLKLGVALFIVSEVMFFFALFWAFFHSSLNPSHNIGGVWPPAAIQVVKFYLSPLTNTVALISSGITITWAQKAVSARAKRHGIIALISTLAYAFFFNCYQVSEYVSLPFNISDGIYGSCFYMITGFHGFHVFVGSVAIAVALVRLVKNHFTSKQHLGLTFAAWYWHFVDVVWVFVFLAIYCWGNSKTGLFG